jgi:predicted RNA-binding protein
MCQSNACLIQDGNQQPLLQDVVSVKPEGEKILLSNIFGEQELVDAKIKIIDLLHHKIILEKRV